LRKDSAAVVNGGGAMKGVRFWHIVIAIRIVSFRKLAGYIKEKATPNKPPRQSLLLQVNEVESRLPCVVD
jgi:hypothetical protein